MRLGVIDIGSNTVHLLVVDAHPGAQPLPAFLLPQFLLCGLLVPRDQLPTVLEWVSNLLPLSYAVDAMKEIAANADPVTAVLGDLAIVAAFIAGALALASLTLSRRSA